MTIVLAVVLYGTMILGWAALLTWSALPPYTRLFLRPREVPAAVLALLAGRAARRRLRFILEMRASAAERVPPKPPKVLLPQVPRDGTQWTRPVAPQYAPVLERDRLPSVSADPGMVSAAEWDKAVARLTEQMRRSIIASSMSMTLGRDWRVSPLHHRGEPANPPVSGGGVTMTGRSYIVDDNLKPGQLSDAVCRHMAANPGKTLTFEDMVAIVRQLKEENGESHV